MMEPYPRPNFMSQLKKNLRNPKFIVVLGLILIGIVLMATRGFQTSAKEITYAELAKAIAGEANASFFSVHGTDFTEVFGGVGAPSLPTSNHTSCERRKKRSVHLHPTETLCGPDQPDEDEIH